LAITTAAFKVLSRRIRKPVDASLKNVAPGDLRARRMVNCL